MKDRIVLKAVDGTCGDCFFDRSGLCQEANCYPGKIYIKDTKLPESYIPGATKMVKGEDK